jgi:group I intron endonuclease
MKDATCGIYRILNRKNGKGYLGSSKQIRIRFNTHKRDLRLKIHDNDYLQHAWNKYGPQNFVFEIVELCSEDKLIEREQYWMDYYKSYDRSKGYNIMPKANCSVITDEIREKISIANTGKKRSRKHKEAVRKAHLGKPTWKLDMWKKTLKDVNELLNFYQEGNSLAECTRRFGIGYAVLKRILIQNKLRIRIGGESQKGIAGRKPLPRVKSICPTCSKEYESPPWRVPEHCSLECAGLRGRQVTNLCVTCNQPVTSPISTNRKFCNWSCYSEHKKLKVS